MKFLLFYLMVPLMLLAQETPSLKLECHTIPKSEQKICTSKTPSAYSMYADIVFYSKSKDSLRLLGMNKADIASFGGFGFSNGGKYMYLAWAEEGHEHYLFYETKDFLEIAQEAKVIYILDAYEFKEFRNFEDSGRISYTLYSQENVEVIYLNGPSKKNLE